MNTKTKILALALLSLSVTTKANATCSGGSRDSWIKSSATTKTQPGLGLNELEKLGLQALAEKNAVADCRNKAENYDYCYRITEHTTEVTCSEDKSTCSATAYALGRRCYRFR